MAAAVRGRWRRWAALQPAYYPPIFGTVGRPLSPNFFFSALWQTLRMRERPEEGGAWALDPLATERAPPHCARPSLFRQRRRRPLIYDPGLAAVALRVGFLVPCTAADSARLSGNTGDVNAASLRRHRRILSRARTPWTQRT